jgi:hypothetical protein
MTQTYPLSPVGRGAQPILGAEEQLIRGSAHNIRLFITTARNEVAPCLAL